jgi:hypothetical protein
MAQLLIVGEWSRVQALQNEVMRKVQTYGLIRKEGTTEVLAEINSQRPPVLVVIDQLTDWTTIQEAAEAKGIEWTIIDPTIPEQRQRLIQQLQGAQH